MDKGKAHTRIEEMDREIGARVREIRMSKHISQAALGEQLDVSFQQIQKYERGTNRISVSSLVQICSALEVGPLEIIGKFFNAEGNSVTADEYRAALAAMQKRLYDIEERMRKIKELADYSA